MAGAIPSGSDPSGWSAGSTASAPTDITPGQGYDASAAPGAVVGTGATVDGQLTGVAAGISNLVNRTQDLVTSAYQSVVQNNDTLTTYSNQVFEGLNPDGSTPLSTLIIQALGAAFGVPQDQLTSTEASLTAIGNTFTALGGNVTTATNNFNTLLTNLGQADAAALATFLTNVSNNASGAAGDWSTLLTTLEQADAAAFAAFVSASNANAQSAYNNWTTLFEELGASATNATTLASWLTGINSTASTAGTNATEALSNWTTVFEDIGLSENTATELASWLSGVNTTASSASTAATSAQSTANTASTNASSALSQFTSMLSAAGQATAAAVGTALSTVTSNLQTTWNNLVTAFTGTSSSGQTASNVQTAAAAVTSTANTASTNASTAITNASTAQGTANTVSSTLTNTWSTIMSALGYTGSTGWYPSEVAQLVLEADQINQANGSEILSWPSSGSNSALSATGTSGPTLTTNALNGHPVAYFNAVDSQTLSVADLSYTAGGGWSMFFVGNETTVSNYAMWLSDGHGGWELRANATSTELSILGGTFNKTTSSSVMNSYHIGEITFDGTTGDTSGYLDGNQVGTTVTGNSSAPAYSTWWLGSRAGAYLLTGNIAAVVIVNGSLADADRQRVEGFLAWKYGLVSNLPAGHPYISAPPGGSIGTPPITTPTLTSVSSALGTVTTALGTAATNIQSTWDDLWQAFTGGTGTGNTVGAVQTAATAVTATANTASTNAGSALSQFTAMLSAAGQATSAALGTALSTLGTSLQSTWDDLVSAFTGSSSTGNTASTVQTAASAVTSTANTASTNASTAISNASSAQTTANTASTNASSALSQWTSAITAAGAASATALGTALSNAVTNIQTGWDDLWQGLTGGSSTGHSAADVQTAAAATASTANTASTNASTAITNASTAQGTANTASTNASSALSSLTSLISAASLSTITAVGNAIASATTNIQTTWDDLWQAFTGNTGTGNTVGALKTAAAATTSTANTASSNASTALTNASTAQGTANTASTNASSALSQFTSLLSAAGQSTASAVGAALSTAVTNIQTGWDDLWQGLTGGTTTGHSASDVQTAAAATTSTANTASSNASTALTNASTAQGTANTASTNASSALSQFTSMISAAGQATAAAVGTALSTAATNIQTTWDNLYQAFAGGSSTGNSVSNVKTAAAAVTSTSNTASTNASTALTNASTAQSAANTASTNASTAGTNIANLINSIPQNLQGASGTQTQAQASAALAATAATQGYLSTQVAALQAKASATGNSGTSVSVNFQTAGGLSTVNANTIAAITGVLNFATIAGTGTWYDNSGAGVFFSYGSGSQAESFLMSQIASQTDYQLFSTVFNDLGSGASYFIFRANSATAPTAYGICVITSLYAQLYWISGGTQTQIGSTQYFSLQGGTPIQFEAGASGAVRSFNLLQNGTPIASWSDTGGTTQYGSGYRNGGMGANLTSSSTAFQVTYFGFADNAPPPIAGSKLRVACNTTSGVGNPSLSTGTNKFTTFYNDIIEQSADIAYNTSTGIATVSVAGEYAVKVKYLTTSGLSNQMMGTCVYHAASGGTTALYDVGQYREIYNSLTKANVISDTFFINCQAGDQIQAGYQTTITGTSWIEGDTALMNATFEVVLCNVSTQG